MNTIKTDIAIIGAGASGLMLASLLKKHSYMIIEHNHKIGAKLLVCGGGKCNITNTQMSAKHFLADNKFISQILDVFDQHRLISWLKKQGLKPVLRNKRDYFCKDSSKEIVDIFKNKIDLNSLKLSTKVLKVTKEKEYFTIYTNDQNIVAKKVVVATGGLSFPFLKASSIGYDIAKYFGHTIIQTSPALVGFTLQKEQFFFKLLSGISTEVVVSVGEKSYKAPLLFTHKGFSGPAILNASLHWKRGSLLIDFLPDFDFKALKSSNKLLSTILPMPKRLSKALLEHINLHDISCKKLTKQDIEKLATLKAYKFAPSGTFGYSKAEVTKGGINTDEIDSQTMMSKKMDKLYFIGEVLDVTGELGGYNLQWAFSSAFVCARDLFD